MRDEQDLPGDDQEDTVAAVHRVEPVWLVSAKVVDERAYGPGGAETRRGLRKLRAGARVWVIGGFAGMGWETVTVVGRARRDNRYLTIHVPTRHLRALRVQLAYSPHVLREALNPERYGAPVGRWPPDGTEEHRQRLERVVDGLLWGHLDTVRAHLVGGPLDGTTHLLPKDQVSPVLTLDTPDGGTVTYELARTDGSLTEYHIRTPG